MSVRVSRERLARRPERSLLAPVDRIDLRAVEHEHGLERQASVVGLLVAELLALLDRDGGDDGDRPLTLLHAIPKPQPRFEPRDERRVRARKRDQQLLRGLLQPLAIGTAALVALLIPVRRRRDVLAMTAPFCGEGPTVAGLCRPHRTSAGVRKSGRPDLRRARPLRSPRQPGSHAGSWRWATVSVYAPRVPWEWPVGALCAFVLALVTTPAGVSGAVLLLPIQLSILHVPIPAVTPTNLLFNGATDSSVGGVNAVAG
jgi:hypothetical protein